MSDENRLQTEEELWDMLSEPVVAEGKAKPAPKAKPVPKAEGRFARSGAAEFKAEPAAAPAQNKEGRKFDGFFFACMAGVATVSVAATLILGSMLGGEKPAAPNKNNAPIETNPGITDEFIAPEVEGSVVEVPGETDPSAQLLEELAQLRLENAELQAQLAQQKQQVTNLLADLMALKGGDTSISAPSGTDGEQVDAQTEAYNIFNQIKKAYADFDRAKLEELIPQMDQRVNYLGSEDLNEYYLILEYVEQPSNG
jgi:hypothetical protein